MIVGEFVLWFPRKNEYILLFFVAELLAKLTEQGRVVFVHLRCCSNVALRPVVCSCLLVHSLLAKMTI